MNAREEILKDLIDRNELGYSYENIMATEGTINTFVNIALDAMEQYASQSSARYREALEKMSKAAQGLFDQKNTNPKNKGQGFQNAWNSLAIALYETNELLNKNLSSSDQDDRWIWDDKKVLEYAKWYRFSSSRTSIEQFKEDYEKNNPPSLPKQ